MKDLVIGDCHFGIKTNSIFWLNKQIEFFDKVVMPTIRTENIDRNNIVSISILKSC